MLYLAITIIDFRLNRLFKYEPKTKRCLWKNLKNVRIYRKQYLTIFTLVTQFPRMYLRTSSNYCWRENQTLNAKLTIIIKLSSGWAFTRFKNQSRRMEGKAICPKGQTILPHNFHFAELINTINPINSYKI